jgi:hypothetical protein
LFCDSEEYIHHQYIACPFTHLICRVVSLILTFPHHLVLRICSTVGWNGTCKSVKAKRPIDVCALVWSIWNYRNNVIFNKIENAQFFTYYHTGSTQGLTSWHHAYMDYGCNRLPTVAWDIYN